MTRNEGDQIARIIFNMFEHEEQVDPRTIAKMFQYMGRMDDIDIKEEIGTIKRK